MTKLSCKAQPGSWWHHGSLSLCIYLSPSIFTLDLVLNPQILTYNIKIVQAPVGIFGVPLEVSIKYANVAISLTNEQGESYVYGYVPIVVAKCGVFLKEKGKTINTCFLLTLFLTIWLQLPTSRAYFD